MKSFLLNFLFFQVNIIMFMSSRTTYLPLNIFNFFPNIQKLNALNTETKMEAPKNGHFLLGKKLQQILLMNQRMKDLGPKIFEGAANAKLIKLDNSEITSLDEDTFSNLSNLETLTLSNNEIKSLPESVFSTLSRLQYIDLGSNMLHTLPKTLFDSNRFLEKIKIDRNRMLLIPPIFMAQNTHYDLVSSFCVDQIFNRTSDLNDFTKERCQIDMDPFDLVTSYRTQHEIDQICEDKNMLSKLESHLKSLTFEKHKLESEKENLEHEIIKTKIYKNSMC